MEKDITRQCKKCNKDLTVDNFYIRKNSIDWVCKKCVAERKKMWRHKKGKSKTYKLEDGECRKCHKIYPRTEEYFYYGGKSARKDGLKNYCKFCTSEKEKTEIYLNEHPEINRRKYTQLKYYNKIKENPKVFKDRNRKYILANIEKIKEYRIKNKSVLKEKQNIYEKNRKKVDINYKLKKNLSTSLYIALKRSKKSNTTEKLLGCTLNEFKLYLESKFKSGMNWENWAVNGWHIDHIIPISSFDLSKDEDQKNCFHYTNLQPLWWYENIKKSNKIL